MKAVKASVQPERVSRLSHRRVRFGKRQREDKGVSKDAPETHPEAIAGGKALGIGGREVKFEAFGVP